jgi:hypothetical protein
VIAITVAPLIQSLIENQMQFMLNVVGLKMRNGLMAAIYRKCLRLSNAALQSESTGRVVTLMSNDAQKVGQQEGELGQLPGGGAQQQQGRQSPGAGCQLVSRVSQTDCSCSR